MHVRNRGGISRRLADEAGVSLIEVMVAMFLLATAMMAMAQVATTGLFSVRDATDRTTAIGVATRSLEAARQLPWEQLQLQSTAHASRCNTLVPIDDGATVTEAVICHISGGIREEGPFWGSDGAYDVSTYVTTIPGFANARRVTAVVEWPHGSQVRTLRSSTVIAQVARG